MHIACKHVLYFCCKRIGTEIRETYNSIIMFIYASDALWLWLKRSGMLHNTTESPWAATAAAATERLRVGVAPFEHARHVKIYVCNARTSQAQVPHAIGIAPQHHLHGELDRSPAKNLSFPTVCCSYSGADYNLVR